MVALSASLPISHSVCSCFICFSFSHPVSPYFSLLLLCFLFSTSVNMLDYLSLTNISFCVNFNPSFIFLSSTYKHFSYKLIDWNAQGQTGLNSNLPPHCWNIEKYVIAVRRGRAGVSSYLPKKKKCSKVAAAQKFYILCHDVWPRLKFPSYKRAAQCNKWANYFFQKTHKFICSGCSRNQP